MGWEGRKGRETLREAAAGVKAPQGRGANRAGSEAGAAAPLRPPFLCLASPAPQRDPPRTAEVLGTCWWSRCCSPKRRGVDLHEVKGSSGPSRGLRPLALGGHWAALRLLPPLLLCFQGVLLCWG